MKNWILLGGFALLLATFGAKGQATIKGYEWWYDQSFEEAVFTSVTAPELLELDVSFATENLSTGLHSLHIRFLDNFNRYSPVVSRFFFKPAGLNISDKEIVSSQWWIDQDFNAAINEQLIPGSLFNFNMNMDLNTLGDGLHTIHFRFRDDSGLWSPVYSTFFFKPFEFNVSNKEILACQWWLDQNFINATTEQLPPGNILVWSNNIDMNLLDDGLHSIHFRYMDNTEMWSPVVSRFFYKDSNQLLQDKQVTEYRYWFDDHPENMVTNTLNAAPTTPLSIELDLDTITEGIHTFNIQFRDNTGQWSVPLNRFFVKRNTQLPADHEMISFRYWLDEDFDSAFEVMIPAPAVLLDITEWLDLTQVWKGEHILHLQMKDNQGLWSSVILDTIYKQSLPIASFEFGLEVFCDSTVASMENHSIDGDVYYWDFGDGTTSTEQEPLHTFTAPGDYTIGLTVTDTLTGVDSTITKPVTIVLSTTYGSIDPVACDNYLSPSGNYTWNASGIYYDTLENALGCDSVITINLTILSNSFVTITESSCDSYTSPSGSYTWTSSGVYYDTLVNMAGCDSVITIDLTISETTYATIEESTCDFYLSPSGNHIWYETGIYSDTVPNSAGCDSILTVNLTVVEVDTSVTNNDPVLTANAENAEYQWIDCSTMEPVPGATGQSFMATMNGSYAVIVTQEECTDTSSCYTVMSVDIGKNPFEDGIHIFPNPTGGSVKLQLGKMLGEVMVFVRNNEGKLVVSKLFYNISETQLEIPGPPGQYTLEILSKEGDKAVLKIIRN